MSSLLLSSIACLELYPGRRGLSCFLPEEVFLSGGFVCCSDLPDSLFIEISGVRHFITLLTSFSLTRNCSVTFFPRNPSPPFLKSLPFILIFPNLVVGTPWRLFFVKFCPCPCKGDSSVVPSVRCGSGVRVPSSLKRSGGSFLKDHSLG